MDGWITIGTKLDDRDFTKEIAKLEDKLDTLEQEYEVLKSAKPYASQREDLIEYEAQIEKTKNQIISLKKKQDAVDSKSLKNVEKTLQNIGSETSNTIKKMGRWAVAIFGVRSAYMFVRQSISTLSQYNQQLADDLQYIRYAIATTLQPTIEALVSAVYKLLQYINYIAQGWFGVNLFANATAKSMNKSVKSAKELKKQLAGFDEMNVLSDTSGGAGAGGVSPSVDLSKMLGDEDVPGWVKWIKDNGEIIISVIGGVTAALVSLKVFGIDPIKSLGIGIAIAGIIQTIQSLIKFIQDPSFENFTEILKGVAIAVLGVAIAFGMWPVAIGAAVALAVAIVIEKFDEIKDKFDWFTNWLEGDFINKIGEIFGPVGQILVLPFIFWANKLKGIFEGVYGGMKKIIEGIVLMFKGELKDGISKVFGGLKDILLAPINSFIAGINGLIRGLNKIKFDVPDWVPVIGGKNLGFNIPEIPRLAVGGIVNMPGRGINYGGANIAERGPEGIIPLTNSQSMAQLGEAIGKYIIINANIVNSMNGRVISKELKKIQGNSDFAFNR